MELLDKYDAEYKVCSRCKVQKPASLEYFHRTRGVYLDSWCKDCRRDVQRGCQYKREYRYLKKYGMTISDYDDMVKKQDNKCDICACPPDHPKGLFHIDHDHFTEEVRGLLCGSCNKGLGMFKDSPEFLENAVSYLKKYE